jgi:hypothetical protein
MGINKPQGTSMDYKNFTPTYSHRFIPTDKMDMDADEYWTPKALQTHSKIKKLYGVMYDEMSNPVNVGSMDYELLDKVIDLKSKVGMWVIERTDNPRSGDYRRRNLITDSEWETNYHYDSFEGIHYSVWVSGEGIMIVLPSKETIEWLNMLAYLYCVSNKETV